MSEAKNLARALNLSHRDGLDMMGGADAEAMAPGSEDPLSDCKSLITVNYNPHQFIIFFFPFFLGDEEFDGHFTIYYEGNKFKFKNFFDKKTKQNNFL